MKNQKATKVLCCGAERTSSFCPDCGKCLKEASPLAELLKYCIARKKESEDRHTSHKEAASRTADNAYLLKFADTYAKKALVWQSYIEALSNVIKEQSQE